MGSPTCVILSKPICESKFNEFINKYQYIAYEDSEIDGQDEIAIAFHAKTKTNVLMSVFAIKDKQTNNIVRLMCSDYHESSLELKAFSAHFRSNHIKYWFYRPTDRSYSSYDNKICFETHIFNKDNITQAYNFCVDNGATAYLTGDTITVYIKSKKSKIIRH